MTVRAPHDTLSDFSLGVKYALGETDIEFLVPVNVVEVERPRIAEAAISATTFLLVGAKPRPDSSVSLVSLPVGSLSVARTHKPGCAPRLRLDGVVNTLAWASISFQNLARVARPPSIRCRPSMFDSFLLGKHNWIIP